MRPLKPMEAVVVASIVGSVLAVAVPAFVRNVHASRLVEPIEGLGRIGARATAYARGRPVNEAYPPSAPLTPSVVPKGESVEDPEGQWAHPTWKILEFKLEGPHYFSFAFDSKNGNRTSTFVARAHGDLDGDGEYSDFELSGESKVGNEPVLFPIEIEREVE